MRIHNFSVGQEDFFLICFDNPTINVLIDSGKSTKRFKEKIDKMKLKELNYAVLTHIDHDHICGLIKSLETSSYFKDTIFVYNKFVDGEISFREAEQFEKLISGHHNIVSYKEYQENLGYIKFLSVSQRKKLNPKPDDIYITFLYPDRNIVHELYEHYLYYKDHSGKLRNEKAIVVNRSSIMLIIENNGKAVLMAGDGYISDIVGFIGELSNDSKTLSPIKRFDLIKIPHHGSENNNQLLGDLLKQTDCQNFIITNDFKEANKRSVLVKEGLVKILEGKKVYCSSHGGYYIPKDGGCGIEIIQKQVIKL